MASGRSSERTPSEDGEGRMEREQFVDVEEHLVLIIIPSTFDNDAHKAVLPSYPLNWRK